MVAQLVVVLRQFLTVLLLRRRLSIIVDLLDEQEWLVTTAPLD